MNKFATRFKELLKNSDYNQTTFGEKIGFSPRTVSNWCNGDSEPNYDTLLKICGELHESADYMLGLRDE